MYRFFNIEKTFDNVGWGKIYDTLKKIKFKKREIIVIFR